MSSPPEKSSVGTLTAELAELGHSGDVRFFRAGDVIFSAGDPGDGFYVVQTGVVNIAAAAVQKELRLLATIGPGEFFGEMAVLDDAPRSATATAGQDTQALYFGRDQLLALLAHRPQLALSLIREFSARMRALNRKYVDETIHAERLAAVGRFATTIVHDFKNPLATISLAGEIAGDAHTPPALRQRAQLQIERQIGRMSNMLNELIEFTRPSDRHARLESADLPAYLAPILADIRDEIAPRHVLLEIATPPPAIEVRLQPARLARLLYNLVNNAVDEMPRGGKISLRFTVTGGELRIDVADTGPGIAPEIALQLFQPFATHGKAHGTGLGLSICKKIAEDHGGRIWAESVAGQGATFSFTLPLAK